VRWAGHVAHMGEMRNAYETLFRKLEGKGQFGGRRCRWEDNIIMGLKVEGYEVVDWIQLVRIGPVKRSCEHC